MTASPVSFQPRLPELPTGAESVSLELAVARSDGRITFFNAAGPIFACLMSDCISVRRAVVMFIELKVANISQMAKAVGVHRNTVAEYWKSRSWGVRTEHPQQGP